MQKNNLKFLINLWHNPDVMKYADEFPKMRGWSRSDDPQAAWKEYMKKRARFGNSYTQLILRLDDDCIGESFFFPLPEAYTYGKWSKPNAVKALMGDIKLLPHYWGKGLASKGMLLVVQYVFTKTECELFVVPPHRLNPAAIRVYEKAGFILFSGMRSWRNHKIMELTKERVQELFSL
ncbi:MAG: GNAT family N-acetyltransferase [Promethearchaeota archaeon]